MERPGSFPSFRESSFVSALHAFVVVNSSCFFFSIVYSSYYYFVRGKSAEETIRIVLFQITDVVLFGVAK